MAELITVPTFVFNQGDVFNGENNVERPIIVSYYDGTIDLQQEGEYDKPERILITPEYLDKLFKEIKKHQKEAESFLNRNK